MALPRMRACAVALVALASLAPCLPAAAMPMTAIEGTAYFVSPDGAGVSTDREAPGSVNETIRRICDGSATPITGGDAIIFLDGTYRTSSFALALPRDERQPGREGNAIAMLGKRCGGPLYIKLLADNLHGAKIVNDVLGNRTSGGFDIRDSTYIWVEGFHIIGVNSPLVPFDGGIRFGDGGHHFVARYNLIENTGGGGIGFGGATHARVEGNEIRAAAGAHPFCSSAISFYKLENPEAIAEDAFGYANYIVGNRVFGTRSQPGCDADANADNGIRSSDGNCVILDLFNATGYANRTLIANNLCVDNGGGGVHVFNSSHVDVFNNTLYGNGAQHRLGDLSVVCWPQGETRDVRFINNLVWATGNAPAIATNFNGACTLTGIVHSHNVFVGNAPLVSDFLGVPYPSITTDPAQLRDGAQSNLVGVTPQEIGLRAVGTDPAVADFSIVASDSPAVDAGHSPSLPCDATSSCPFSMDGSALLYDDIAGQPRMQGATFDVGAYEYDGFGTPITPPPSSIVLRAAASPAAGVGASVDIRVNGTVIATLDIDTAELRDYVVPVAVAGPVSFVDIVFTNDAVIDGEDRNLFVSTVTINRRLVSPGDPGVVLDRGSGGEAFDGLDVLPGQNGLWWNGALRIGMVP